MLTAERLREILTYDPEEGHFYWLKPTANCMHVGDIAGCIGSHGYSQISIDGQVYLSHRLAWLYVTGNWPIIEIDHKNQIKNDNHWLNLRLSSSSQNKMNISTRLDNTSGCKGVTYCNDNDHKRKPWRAQIKIRGRNIHLGRFSTVEEAKIAREEAELELFYDFSPLNRSK